MNVSGTVNAFKLLLKPQLCIPHLTVDTFDKIPIPLRRAGWPEIKAVVLDKDNCFAVDRSIYVYKSYEVCLQPLLDCLAYPYIQDRFLLLHWITGGNGFPQKHFQLLRKAYPGPRLLIVSNSAGTDHHVREAEIVEETTGVAVFRHSTKKPGCGQDVFKYFRDIPETGVTKPSDIAVVGDRLFTDVMMANTMSAFSIWVKEGILVHNGPVSDMDASTVLSIC